MKAIIYTRVSTEGQAIIGVSLDFQEEKTRAYCLAHSWEVVAHISDRLSGKNTKRPGLQKALAILKSGEADCLVILRLDRLTRSIKDLVNMVEDSTKNQWQLVSVNDNIDTTRANGRFMLNVLGSTAQFERELLIERVKEGLQKKRIMGEKTGGKPPYGYRVHKSNGRKYLAEQPTEQEVIKEVRALKGQGLSLRQIADQLKANKIANRKGSTEWNPNQIKRILDYTPSLSLNN